MNTAKITRLSLTVRVLPLAPNQGGCVYEATVYGERDGKYCFYEDVQALTARVAELEELLTDWRMAVDMVRRAGVDSVHGAKMVRNGVEQRMYAAAEQLRPSDADAEKS